MPMHDWTKVDAGIFHDFHQEWTIRLSRVLNQSLLPADHYALLMMARTPTPVEVDECEEPHIRYAGTAVRERPESACPLLSDATHYGRIKNRVSIRRTSDDRIVSLIDVVCPGNKKGRIVFRRYVDELAESLEKGIHLLVLDPIPPHVHDPAGIHAAFIRELDGSDFSLPVDKPLTFVSYEAVSNGDPMAVVKHLAIGDELPEMPVFFETNGCVMLPLEETYRSALEAVPKRWRDVIAGDARSTD